MTEQELRGKIGKLVQSVSTEDMSWFSAMDKTDEILSLIKEDGWLLPEQAEELKKEIQKVNSEKIRLMLDSNKSVNRYGFSRSE